MKTLIQGFVGSCVVIGIAVLVSGVLGLVVHYLAKAFAFGWGLCA